MGYHEEFKDKVAVQLNQSLMEEGMQVLDVTFSDGIQIREFREWPTAIFPSGDHYAVRELLFAVCNTGATEAEIYNFIKSASKIKSFSYLNRESA